MWAIHAVKVETRVDSHGVSWRSMSQVPMFYLSDNVQGIRTQDHAIRVARDILGTQEGTEYNVWAGYIHTKAMEGA